MSNIDDLLNEMNEMMDDNKKVGGAQVKKAPAED
jgi:hypothetical protein